MVQIVILGHIRQSSEAKTITSTSPLIALFIRKSLTVWIFKIRHGEVGHSFSVFKHTFMYIEDSFDSVEFSIKNGFSANLKKIYKASAPWTIAKRAQNE